MQPNNTMTAQEYKTLEEGQKVDYSLFRNVEYLGESNEGKHVKMRDKYGNNKEVWKGLFLKHSSIRNAKGHVR